MAQAKLLTLPVPCSPANPQDLEHQVLHLRTEQAFSNDKNHMLQTQLDFHALSY